MQEKLNGTVIKQWIWNGGAQPAEERDGSNAVTKRFYGLGEQIGGIAYFFTADHLGSIREMIDSTGLIRARYDYDPYGRITKVSGDLEADFGFTGFYRHQASGLSLTLYRAYDADLGRWLNRDPLGESQGANTYRYGLNNALNVTDPMGLAVKFADNADVDALKQTVAFLTQSPSFRAAWEQLEHSKTLYTIGTDYDATMGDDIGQFQGDRRPNPGIVFNPAIGKQWGGIHGGQIESPALIFAHEIGHALDYDNNVLGQKRKCPLNKKEPPYYAPNQAEASAQDFAHKVAQELNVFAPLDYTGPNFDRLVFFRNPVSR